MTDLDTDPDALPVSWMTRGRLRRLLRERDGARIRAEQAEDTLLLVQQQRNRAVAQLRATETRHLIPDAISDETVERVRGELSHYGHAISTTLLRDILTAALTEPQRSEGAERNQHVLTTYWDFGETPRGLADALAEDDYRIVKDGGER